MLVSTHRQPGLMVKGHRFEIPLDHNQSKGSTISVFARELISAQTPQSDAPFIVYLQDGPGFESRPPLTCSGWIKAALQKYRVLLLDQRGTGNNSPISAQTLARLPNPIAQAEYLSLFRADSIVKDAE